MKKDKELNVLEVNKTVVFTTPISEKNKCLVRTGTINNDSSSLLHSVLLAYSKDYFYMDNKNRIKFLNKLKLNIFNKQTFDKNNFEKFKNKFFKVFEVFYNYMITKEEIKEEKIVNNIVKHELHDIICELIPIEDFKNISFIKKDDQTFFEIESYLNNLDILNYIEKEKSIFIKKNIKEIVNNVILEIEKEEYNNYLDRIFKQIDIDVINQISKCLKINIYFIDYKTRLPFLFDSKQTFKNNKSVIILKLENNYENIGLLLEENKVQREFKLDKDEIIKKINTFLLFPEKINRKYPELNEYLPKKTISKNSYFSDENDECEEDNEVSKKVDKLVENELSIEN